MHFFFQINFQRITMSKFLHPRFLSFLLPLFYFIAGSNAAQAAGETYPNCPTYNCSGVTIRYPFYQLGNISTTGYCGYPALGINCSTTAGGRDRPIIHLHDNYYVEDIDYDNRTFTLVDIDAATAASSTGCPRIRHGINLSGLPLNLSTVNVNLSFHFNCTRVPPSFATVIPCLRSGNNQSCVYIEGTERGNFDWETNCQDEVVKPVLEMAVNSTGSLATGYRGALSGGFELNWRNWEGCRRCEDNGGRCGYNMEAEKFICFCPYGPMMTDTDSCYGEDNWKNNLIIGVIILMSACGLVGCIYGCCRMQNYSLKSSCMTKNDRTIEDFIEEYGSLTPKRYDYFQIKKITKSFDVKLGQGGFGSVYKGKLSDGRLVAVKLLNSSKANGEEFVNEVASIGRTSHVNVVALLGFCYEGQKRALIYEFMPNGSLDKFICNNVPLGTAQSLTVNKLYEVALGIARGLEYLHRGCNIRILHLDIKPHNILLDEDFCPKIADFGLAKLHSRKESIVSMLEARGTIGYIAPEIFSRNFGGVSHKSDVYSYGMMILEMVGGRENVNARIDHSSDMYFPHWIYKRLEENELGLEGLGTVEENELVRKMILVGLWCIQTDPSRRPPMNKVIEMLQGSIDAITIPPKPFFSSPSRSPENMFAATSESVSM